jgi:hypothetical protein
MLKINRRFGGKCRFHLQVLRVNKSKNQQKAGSKQNFMLFSCLSYISNVKKGVTCSSETSVDIQRTARRFISKYRTLRAVLVLRLLGN